MTGAAVSPASLITTATESALGAAVLAAMVNTAWVQLEILGGEPTRRPASLLLAGLVVYGAASLALGLAVGLLRRWRRPGRDAGFGLMLATSVATWVSVFALGALLDATESRSVAFFGAALAALLGGAGLALGLSRRLPGSVPGPWRWSVYPVLLGLLAWGLWPAREPAGGQARGAIAGRPPNVVLLVLDTLRADHLSSYGYRAGATPTLDALAREGVRFETVVSASSWTLPSVASIMTAQLPSVHGAGATRLTLDSRLPTLAKLLRYHGFATGGFAGGPYCKAYFGFAEGFDLYDDELDPLWGKVMALRVSNRLAWFLAERHFIPIKRRAAAINREVFPWLERVRGQPFFLFINYFDAHTPYDPPAGHRPPPSDGRVNGYVDWWKDRYYRGELTLTPADRAHLLALYDGEIAYLDREVGRLLAKLRELGELDRTLLVVTADHGEAFLEHRLLTHGESLYEEEIRVPLIFRFPAMLPAGVTVGAPVQSFDILPTVLELLRLPVPVGLQGISLAEVLRAGRPAPDRPAVSQLYRGPDWGSDVRRDGPDLMAIREGDWKYVAASDGHPELYHLDADPRERENLSASGPATAARLADRLRTVVGEPLWPPPAGRALKPDASVR